MDFKSLHNARRIKNDDWCSVDGVKDYSFVVKYYQRGYRWTRNNIRKLLCDIESYIEKGLVDFPEITDYIKESCQRKDKTVYYDFYCMQALSVQCLDDKSHKYELIDGQQRLTSVLILYELLGLFTESMDERPKSLYTIQYVRGNSESFDLTDFVRGAMPGKTLNMSPLKAYKSPRIESRDEWFEEYKRQLSQNFQSPLDIHKKLAGDSLVIDLYYLSEVACEIVDFIKNYRDDEDSVDNLKKFYSILKQDVLFIWYEISVEMSAENEFIQLNSNKINLTNAELIKALVLKENEDGKIFENAGNRWEAIEQGLCHDEFWAFIGGEDKATRIDLVLELLAHNTDEDYSLNTDNENALFDWYEQKTVVYSQSEFSKFVVEGIEKIFNRICEWYDDVEIFHYIGLLTCFREKLMKKQSQEEMIKSIFDEYATSESKEEFAKKLRSRIKECILFNVKLDDQPSSTITEIIDSNFFSYEDSTQHNNIKAILWYLNAWETIEASENNIVADKTNKKRKSIIIKRLPFSQISSVNNKKDSWTLEHIMPQNPGDDASKENKDKYDTLMKSVARDSATAKVVEDDDIHMIGNLALLRHSDNSAIHNGNLFVKRQELIQKSIGEGSFVPIATINAFGLYYNMVDGYMSDEIDMKYWTTRNRDQYLKRIKQALETLER